MRPVPHTTDEPWTLRGPARRARRWPLSQVSIGPHASLPLPLHICTHALLILHIALCWGLCLRSLESASAWRACKRWTKMLPEYRVAPYSALWWPWIRMRKTILRLPLLRLLRQQLRRWLDRRWKSRKRRCSLSVSSYRDRMRVLLAQATDRVTATTRSAPLLRLFPPPEHFMTAGCCAQIVEATGRMAAKTIISASGDGISKITGAIVIVQDEQHVAALKSKAAAVNFVAYTKSELATCGDPRALSFSTDFNLLFVDTSAFPLPPFNFMEPSHRAWLAHTWLAAIASILPALPEGGGLAGLTLNFLDSSLQRSSRRVSGSTGVTKAVTGMIVVFTATVTASGNEKVSLASLPKFMNKIMPRKVAYDATTKKLATIDTFEVLKAKDYKYTIPLRVGWCPFHAKVCDPEGGECPRMKKHRLSLAIVKSSKHTSRALNPASSS